MQHHGSRVVQSLKWKPKVTAVLPSYNAADFIADTLESLASQTWTNLEILVGDDASRDETADILQRFAAVHDNVVLILRDTNLGWLENCNDLMSKASGELMFFAFHDDVVSSNYVEKLVDALRVHPEAVLAYSDVKLSQPNGASAELAFEGVGTNKSTVARALRMGMRLEGWWIPNRGLFRTSAFHKIGGMRRSNAGEICADWVWMLEMSMVGPFVRVPEVLCYKHFKDASLSRGWERKGISPEQWREVGKQAIEGVRMSGLSYPEKILLSMCIKGLNNFPAIHRALPTSFKRRIKLVLNRVTN